MKYYTKAYLSSYIYVFLSYKFVFFIIQIYICTKKNPIKALKCGIIQIWGRGDWLLSADDSTCSQLLSIKRKKTCICFFPILYFLHLEIKYFLQITSVFLTPTISICCQQMTRPAPSSCPSKGRRHVFVSLSFK